AQNRLHVGRSVYFLFANSWPAPLFRFRATRKGVREVGIASVWSPDGAPEDTQPNRGPADLRARPVATTDKPAASRRQQARQWIITRGEAAACRGLRDPCIWWRR